MSAANKLIWTTVFSSSTRAEGMVHGHRAEHSESAWKRVRDGGAGDSCSGVLVGPLGAAPVRQVNPARLI